jgi:hypothetical protein
MFVGEHNAAHPAKVETDGLCPTLHLPNAEPGIDQKCLPLRLDRAAVTPRPRAEYVEGDHRALR